MELMKTTVDPDGRVMLPEELRAEAGICPGMELDARWEDGRIELAPLEAAVRLERRGGLVVAVPAGPMEPLTQECVDETVEALRAERLRDMLQ